MKIKELNLNKLKAKWFYFSSLMEESYKTQEKIVDFAIEKKIKNINTLNRKIFFLAHKEKNNANAAPPIPIWNKEKDDLFELRNNMYAMLPEINAFA